MREDDDDKMFLQNFLRKVTITCFVFLAKKGLTATESLKDLVVRQDVISDYWELDISFGKAHFSNWK